MIFSVLLQSRGTNSSFCFLSILLCFQLGQRSPQFCKLSFFVYNYKGSRLAEIWWSVCISKSQRSLCVSFFRMYIGLCIYHLFVRSNWNFWYISQWLTLPTQSSLVLYSFCANLLHSLIMWLIISSLWPDNLHLLFCCDLSILALIWFVLRAFFVLVLEEIQFLS